MTQKRSLFAIADVLWARARDLEDAGVQVFHGIFGLKTHCKLALLVRQDADGVIEKKWYGEKAVYDEKTKNWELSDGQIVTFNKEGDIIFTDSFPDKQRVIEGWNETPRRIASSQARTNRSGRSFVLRVTQSSLGSPASIRFAAESTRPDCARAFRGLSRRGC